LALQKRRRLIRDETIRKEFGRFVELGVRLINKMLFLGLLISMAFSASGPTEGKRRSSDIKGVVKQGEGQFVIELGVRLIDEVLVYPWPFRLQDCVPKKPYRGEKGVV
jgi:hypothetical protein